MSKVTQQKFSSMGFTLIELLVVIAIIAILAAVVLLAINPVRVIEESRTSTAKANLQQIARAAQQYSVDAGALPADTNRSIPTEFMSYLGPGSWPAGPFPGSVYDWDNWTGQTCWDGTPGGIQVTLRQVNGYKGKTNYNLYLPIQGNGLPHCTSSGEKGECINCTSTHP